MAVVRNEGKIVGKLLLDMNGTNMGIVFEEGLDPGFLGRSQRKFLKAYPTGNKLEDKDIDLTNIALDD